jgi:hypothetical protein
MPLETPKTIESIDRIKDRVFDEYMKIKVMNAFYHDLEDYFSPEEIDVFRQKFYALTDEELISVVSLPHEIRGKIFQKFFKAYQENDDISKVVDDMIALLIPYGFTVGYHTSPHDIKVAEDGSWKIKGTEADHRDGDRMMAYYSTQYRHLFKKRHPKYIYVVRSLLKEGSHNSDGNWHRADSLSVVTKVPFEEVVNYVESTTKNMYGPTK